MKRETKKLGEKQKSKAKYEKDTEPTINDLVGFLNTEQSGFLQAEGPMEKTHKFKQKDIVQAVSMQAAKKRFDLSLPGKGAYKIDYSRDGKQLLIASRQGHLAGMEWESGKLGCELEVEEVVRDACWLHGENFFAAAQQKYTFIYDQSGAEVHRLDKHFQVDHLQYLNYHYLLASVGSKGRLVYQDISSGQVVSEWQTMVGKVKAMKKNPSNGVLHLGHAGGNLTLWSPTVNGPLVTLKCHKSPIEAIAIDEQGNYLVTSGTDSHIKVWDLRTYKALHQYYPVRPATSLAISQKGILAAAYGPHVSLWKDCLASRSKTPYMYHRVDGESISSLSFCPYDDVLGLGHSGGISSILIPGAGEANYDSYEVNPFASKKHRKEANVKQILDKLAPETILLDPAHIGEVAKTHEELIEIKNQIELAASKIEKKKKKERRTVNGKQWNKAKRRENIIDAEKSDIVINGGKNNEGSTIKKFGLEEKKSALDRFKMKAL